MSIEVKNISKTFGTFKALNDVSLHVNSGELVALLGPSGSGKTTLLRIIAGLEQADPEQGSIHFHDEDVARRHVSSRGVGFVFQHYALFRHMSVFENVAFGLRVKRRRDRPSKAFIRDKVHELLKLVQLDGLAGRYPHQLSGGQRQRVALARALAVEPKVLLLDEPFGALDAKVRKELRAWLRRLHDELHVTSVFVTHDQDEALEVADRVVVMHQGKIEQVGTPDDVFHHPATEFVMHFLGDVNAFHGSVGGGTVQFSSLELPFPEDRRQIAGDARVFIRPYDVTIDTKTNGLPSLEAQVVRVHSAGPLARVELLTSANQRLTSEISQERFATMNLAAGSKVYVRPRHIRVFADGEEE
ncbi:sulfate/molybdate ABC transporter ATP-binding protein [Phycisphaerales bacterium AB-hyl4]|uniref:Sulfate/molybdate ABC transporter ATP-binding protein n=1 Tax=Natronomicrosphaera hydrolytica TaxID=3242702 RepID=A0ABV4U369_9BACT